jgi:alpha-galactosidase
MKMACPRTIHCQSDSLHVIFTIKDDDIVRVKSIEPIGEDYGCQIDTEEPEDAALPLVDIRLVGEGTGDTKSSKTLICGLVTDRLKYRSHHKSADEEKQTLEITSFDTVSGLAVTTTIILFEGTPTLRCFSTVKNEGTRNIILCQVTSLVIGGLTKGDKTWWKDYYGSSATNTWFREAQWHDDDLPTLGLDSMGIIELNQGHVGSHATYSLSNRGNFSSGGNLPMGMVRRKDSTETWLWQIENNGSWRWEIGDFKDDVYVALSGPTSFNHNWKECLKPDEEFTTVPCALVHVRDGIDTAFAALTEYRRRIRRPHADNEAMNIIFNDYMNCLM